MHSERRKVRYAVVGLGHIAQVAVLPAFAHARENSELVALVSSDAAKLSALSRKYGIEVTGSYDELPRIVAEGAVDAVYIATPNSLHRELTERASALGTHVLCEKPMAMTEEDCRLMIDAAARHGVKLMVAYRLHFDAANLDVLARVRSGDIGEARVVNAVFCHQVREGDIRTRRNLGGGALFDLGVYCVNAARAIFEDEPVEVLGHQVFGTDVRSREVDELTSAVLRFPGNRIAQLTASQGAADVSVLQVIGEKGTLRLDPAFEISASMEETVSHGEKRRTVSFPKTDQFAPQLIHFSRCILDDEQPAPSADHGLADVRIMQAIQESSRTGKVIPLRSVEPPPGGPDPDLRMQKPPARRVKTIHAPAPSK